MAAKGGEYLSFSEDEFDLNALRQTAAARARRTDLTRRSRRKVSFIKILIIITAFVAAYLLYNVASEALLRYDYYKYHGPAAD